MADSTHTQLDLARPRTVSALLVSLLVLTLACGSWPSAARADGDPASDVLVSQLVFLPQDAGLTVRQQSELEALLNDARRSGYQLRVALIAGSADLGSVTQLWRQPESYAGFLGEELSLVYRGTLLIVMPDGFGLYGPGAGVPAQRSALESVPGSSLGAVTISAVQRLAAAAGHPLRVGTIVARSAPPGSTDFGALIALVLGAVLIAIAWVASLRARPLGSGPAQSGSPEGAPSS